MMNFLLYVYYSGMGARINLTGEINSRRRLPDVLIMGVKKSGTITLGWKCDPIIDKVVVKVLVHVKPNL